MEDRKPISSFNDIALHEAAFGPGVQEEPSHDLPNVPEEFPDISEELPA